VTAERIFVKGLFQTSKPQITKALSRIKRVMAKVKPILILQPPDAEKNVKKLSFPRGKNLACGFGAKLIT